MYPHITSHQMTVASKNDVNGIGEILNGDRILTPKITTVIFDVDDTLYDVSTVSLAAAVVIVSFFFHLPIGRISIVVSCSRNMISFLSLEREILVAVHS